MSGYGAFSEVADGTLFPGRVENIGRVEVPARSSASPANLYVRVTGIANFDLDPRPDPVWFRGTLAVVLPLLQLGDTMLEASANAFFRVIIREEESLSDDFAIALDDVQSVTVKPTGELVISVATAYMGDVWVKRMGFAANLLVHRPSLDNFTPDHQVKFSLENVLRMSTSELSFRSRA